MAMPSPTSESSKSARPFDPRIMHLFGHPLPAFVPLACTDETVFSVDLFMDSLSRPILISTFAMPPDAQAMHNSEAAHQLASLKAYTKALVQEKPNMAVYAMSTQNIDLLRTLRNELKLPFHLLSDTSAQLTDKLELPHTRDEVGHVALEPCTLFMEEGRVALAQYPLVEARQAGALAFQMLRYGLYPST